MAFRAEVFAAKANAGAASASDEEQSKLMKCPTCSRSFKEESFEKHVKLCQHVFAQKRQRFDSSQHRLEGLNIDHQMICEEAPKLQEKMTTCCKNMMPEWKVASFRLRAEVHAQKAIECHKDAILTPEEAESFSKQLHVCEHTGRKFRKEALEKYAKHCKHVFTPFITSRGLKLMTTAKRPQQCAAKLNVNWREKDASLRKVLRAARQKWQRQLAAEIAGGACSGVVSGVWLLCNAYYEDVSPGHHTLDHTSFYIESGKAFNRSCSSLSSSP